MGGREGRRGGRTAGGARTIIFATKATGAHRPQSEINSSRGLLTLSIIPRRLYTPACGGYKYRRVKPTVFPSSSPSPVARRARRDHNTTWRISGRRSARAPASPLPIVRRDARIVSLARINDLVRSCLRTRVMTRGRSTAAFRTVWFYFRI